MISRSSPALLIIPTGYSGYIAYCPQPIHPDDYTYCCNYYYLGKDLPSCCRYPWHTGGLIALFFASIVAILRELDSVSRATA